MMMSKSIKDAHAPIKMAGKTAWAALALWGVFSLAFGALDVIVIGIRPTEGTWCKAPGYVQADFVGYKVKPWAPVPNSYNATVLPLGLEPAPGFEFVDDKAPDSAKPIGRNDFGIWRWYAPKTPEAVRMTMMHTNGTQIVLSSFGFFDVPADAPDC